MNKFRNYFFAAAGFSIVMITLWLTSAGQAIAQSGFSLVKVINPTTEPVPSQITNQPTVKLASGTGVTVNNRESNPVLTQNVNDGVTPFHQSASGTFINGSISGSGIIVVPSGKRLVIEFASVFANVPPGQNVFQAGLSTEIKGERVQHFLSRDVQGPHAGGADMFTASQSLRLYADGGTAIIFSVARSSADGSGSFAVTISGYLIDIP
ncbi:MAG: hypothetical protein AB7U82_28465 [Blastocatellales bacterium]